MERIIKFRAWDRELKKMQMPETIINLEGETTKALKEISPFLTLLQYTGLKDKDGKEIYESDILKTTAILASDKIGNEYFNVVVKWSECRWVANGSLNSYQCGISEIIGNIYENKNLI